MTNSWSSFSQNMSEFYRMPAKELADSIFEVTRVQMYTEVLGKPYSELLSNKTISQLPMPAKELADSIFEVTRVQMFDINKYTEVLGKPYSEVLLKAKANGQFPEKLILSTPPFLGSRAVFDSFLSQTQVFDFESFRKVFIENVCGAAVKNLQEALHQLLEEFDGSNITQLPSNLQGCTDKIKTSDFREFVEQEGIPLYAIPRDRDIVMKLLEAKDRQGRRQILGEFCQSLVVDCTAILEQAKNTVINDLRDSIEDAIAAVCAGYYYAAQALFTVILDTLISYFYPNRENRIKIIGHQRSASVPDEIKAMEIRDALVWLPIWHAHEQFWVDRGDPIPNDRYSRHASVHAVSVDQYNKENCIQVMMLVASLIAYAEQIDS